MEILGDPLTSRRPTIRVIRHVGLDLEACWAHLGAKMRQVKAKMARSELTWSQDVPKMTKVEPRMGNLARFWEHLGDFFWILGAIFPELAKTTKTTRVQHFYRVLGILGVLLEAMLSHLGAMLGYVVPSGRHLGATW